MTNTLHRFGDAESFRDDYVIFAIPTKGVKGQNTVPLLKRFFEIAVEFKPVNLGETRHGGALRPGRGMNPLAHWHRDNTPDFQAVIDGLTDPTTCAALPPQAARARPDPNSTTATTDFRDRIGMPAPPWSPPRAPGSPGSRRWFQCRPAACAPVEGIVSG